MIFQQVAGRPPFSCLPSSQSISEINKNESWKNREENKNGVE